MIPRRPSLIVLTDCHGDLYKIMIKKLQHSSQKLMDYIDTGSRIARTRSSPLAIEIARLVLHRIVTGYGPDQYVAYSLHEKPVNLRAWRQYLDKKDFCKLLFRYNKKTNFHALEDKVAFAAVCRQSDIPHPDILFTCNYSRQNSSVMNYSFDDVHSALDNLAAGDYIIKTCGGSYGLHLWSITKSENGIQVHNNGQLLTSRIFADLLKQTGQSYLVQNKIEVVDSLRPLMPGVACGSMRIYTFLRKDGTVLTPFCIAKLTVVGAVSDNFANGTSGNLTAIIDMKTLSIRRVVAKDKNGLICNISHHPDTDVDLRNYPVPELKQALQMGCRCALAFPDTPAIGWDIVVTSSGAVVLEGNPMFDPYGPQWCEGPNLKKYLPELLDGTN